MAAGIKGTFMQQVSKEERNSCRDLLININRSDYSFALEKLYPGTAGNDEALCG